TWTDDGPSEQDVQDAMVAAGLAAIDHRTWGSPLRSQPGGYGFYFDRYNAYERAAELADMERRREEWHAAERRKQQTISDAAEAKRAAWQLNALPVVSFDPAQANAAHEAFEALRSKAEAQVAGSEDQQHRPHWAPPLILEGELLEACRSLGYLQPDDK